MCKRFALVLGYLAMLFMTNGAKADAWDKKTVITFSQAVELPGVVLPAGTYVFKLVDLPGVRNVVRVMNPDEDKVYATILAITDIHLTPHDETYLGFGERGAGSPQAIREWFYPGNTFGLEFVYPKVRAQELARETGTPVLAAEVKPAEALAELKAEPVVEETPENEEIAFSVAPQTPPLVGLPETRSTPAPILPETASPIPLIALAGLLCFAGATAIKASSR